VDDGGWDFLDLEKSDGEAERESSEDERVDESVEDDSEFQDEEEEEEGKDWDVRGASAALPSHASLRADAHIAAARSSRSWQSPFALRRGC
jgi:hypothetical protein